MINLKYYIFIIIILFLISSSVIVYADNDGAGLTEGVDYETTEKQAGKDINAGMNAGLRLLINWILPGTSALAMALAGLVWLGGDSYNYTGQNSKFLFFEVEGNKEQITLSILFGIIIVGLAPKVVMLLINNLR